MILECKKCGYVWRYKGRKRYATCPSCLGKVKVEQAKSRSRELKDAAISRTAGATRDLLQDFGFSVSAETLEKMIKKALETDEQKKEV